MTGNFFTTWRNHCYRGPCEFSRTAGSFTIQTDVPDGRGSWYCYADVTPAEGEQFLFQGQVDGPGQCRILFYSGDEVASSLAVEGGTIVTIPPDTDRLRLDLRLWNAQGTAVFSGISLDPYEPPPPPEPGLEVPPPDATQKHHVTGWKWGRNIALIIHNCHSEGTEESEESDVPPTYIDQNEDIIPYEVRGWQHGRRLDLQIGNMVVTDEDE
jgi:hypothetical protein